MASLFTKDRIQHLSKDMQMHLSGTFCYVHDYLLPRGLLSTLAPTWAFAHCFLQSSPPR